MPKFEVRKVYFQVSRFSPWLDKAAHDVPHQAMLHGEGHITIKQITQELY